MKRRSIIADKQQYKKSQRRNQIILGVFFAALMIFSAFGVMLYRDNSASGFIEDNGKKFRSVTLDTVPMWQYDGNKAYFFVLPSQVQDVPMSAELAVLQQPSLYLAYDPTQQNLDVIDVMRYMVNEDLRSAGRVGVPAVIGDNSTLPVADCKGEAAVVFRYDNITQVTQNGSCAIVSGATPQEMVRATERLRYAYYGVLNG